MRAARKLIDVDKVVGDHGHPGLVGDDGGGAALLGEQDVPVHRVGRGSGSRCCRTRAFSSAPSPTPCLQVTRGRRVSAVAGGRRRPSPSIPQTPFTQSTFDILNQVLPKGGCTHQKPDLRRQEDDLPHRGRPGAALRARRAPRANGYTPDTVVLLKDLYRAGFKGKILGSRLCDQPEAGRPGRPARGGRGRLHLRAVASAEGSCAFEKAKKLRRAWPTRIPTPARSTTTSTWCLMAMAVGEGGDRRRQSRRTSARPRMSGGKVGRQCRRRHQRRSQPAARSTMPAPRALCDFDEEGRHPRLQVPLRADQGRQVRRW